jgi:hypothetical protein
MPHGRFRRQSRTSGPSSSSNLARVRWRVNGVTTDELLRRILLSLSAACEVHGVKLVLVLRLHMHGLVPTTCVLDESARRTFKFIVHQVSSADTAAHSTKTMFTSAGALQSSGSSSVACESSGASSGATYSSADRGCRRRRWR